MQDQFYAYTISNSSEAFLRGTIYAHKTVASHYGIPYDSRFPHKAKAHWTMFTAATISDAQTRNAMIDLVHRKFSFNGTTGTLPTTYDPYDGATISGPGNPALGAMFAPLALK